MAQYLSPSTYVVAVGPDIVVLDARENAYFCLPGAASALHVGDGGVTFGDPDLAAEFVEAGFVTDEAQPVRGPLARRPTRDLGVHVAGRLRGGDLLLVLAAWLTMFVSYHARDFGRVVQTARRPGGEARQPPLSDDVASLVAAFERILPWLPFQGVCFYRSFLLLRVLRWRGYDARWMFGVHTWPFQAHCWLQIGDVALDDTADRLAGLTPIMEV